MQFVNFADDEPLCAQSDPELWFATKDSKAVALSIGICSVCPVIQKCREFAITEQIEHGVWGGTTPSERHQITRRTGRVRERRAYNCPVTRH